MTPPHITILSPASFLASSFMSIGASVLCPAVCDDIPMTSTFFSTAICAAEFGVANRGLTSTSNSISLNALAIVLAPLSCPSCPSLTMSIRGFLPNFSLSFFILFCAARNVLSFLFVS